MYVRREGIKRAEKKIGFQKKKGARADLIKIATIKIVNK